MNIAGLQKMTLVDFPGCVAATVFTRGCSFRCPFCHNPELVLPEFFNPLIPEEEFFNFLDMRIGKLTGVCITGGEPTIQPDIGNFISHIKAIGFKVKLDTNGSNPERLKELIEEGDIDYIAMDIKAPLDKYMLVANSKLSPDMLKLKDDIKKSVGLIMNSGIDYEFRTTVCHPLHDPADFQQIGELIKGAKRFYIQNFVASKHINSKIKFSSFTSKELATAQKIIEGQVEQARIR